MGELRRSAWAVQTPARFFSEVFEVLVTASQAGDQSGSVTAPHRQRSDRHKPKCSSGTRARLEKKGVFEGEVGRGKTSRLHTGSRVCMPHSASTSAACPDARSPANSGRVHAPVHSPRGSADACAGMTWPRTRMKASTEQSVQWEGERRRKREERGEEKEAVGVGG